MVNFYLRARSRLEIFRGSEKIMEEQNFFVYFDKNDGKMFVPVLY